MGVQPVKGPVSGLMLHYCHLEIINDFEQGAPYFYFTLGPASYVVSLEPNLRQWTSLPFRIRVLSIYCIIPGLWGYDSSFYYKGMIGNLENNWISLFYQGLYLTLCCMIFIGDHIA